MDAVDHFDHVRPWLTLHIEQNGWLAICPGCKSGILGRNDRLSDIGEPQRRIVAVGDDEVHVLIGGLELVIGVDGGGAQGTIERALGLVDVGSRDRVAQVGQGQAIRSKRLWIGLDAHGRSLSSRHAHETDARYLGQALRNPRVHQITHLRQGNRR